MTFTETPGIAALLVSWTMPVMLPRSDCANDREGVARAAVASTIAIKRVITISSSVRLLVRASSRRLVHMGVRVADDRQPRRHAGAGETHTMPRLCWRVCDVPLVGNEDRHRPNLEFHLAFENEPELGTG